jgi:hypothetical protein
MLAALAAKPQPTSEETRRAEDTAGLREAAAKEAYLRVIALLANPENL